jgi:hypothetical protein
MSQIFPTILSQSHKLTTSNREAQFTNQQPPTLFRSPLTPPEMTTIHQRLNQENMHEQESAIERLQSRWSSSSRGIVDRPPLQPLSPQQMSRSLQQSNSKWTSGSGVISDSPPLQPLNHRRSAVGRLQESGSRWSSGSEAACDTASPKVLVRHRTIVQPSNVSAHKHSAAMKNHDLFETTIRACGTGTKLQCAARSA